MAHFVNKVPLPYSMTETVYDVARRLGNYDDQLNLMDTVFLSEDIKRLSPLTVLYAPNSQWQNKKINLADISVSVLKNHIFNTIHWCHELVKLSGTKLESDNGQFWLVSVNPAGFPCFDVITSTNQKSRSCITKCDILARNGVVHEVDEILLYEQLATRGPSPPVPPTFLPPTLTQHSHPRPSALQPSAYAASTMSGAPVAFAKPKPLYDVNTLAAASRASAVVPILSALTAVLFGVVMAI
jgi:hypothetical protein